MLKKFVLASLFTITLGIGALIAFLYLAPETFTRIAVGAARSGAGLTRKEIILPSGDHYVYLDGGQGETLLLLHGFGGNKDNFIQIAPYLIKHYHLIIPDHLGFGESGHPAEADYGPDAQAERLHGLMQALGFKGPVHVGGNSMGGLISLHYGLHYPAETASLWLLDPAGASSAPQTNFIKAAINSPRNPLLVGSTDDLVYLISQAASKPPFIPGPMLQVFAKERINNLELEKKIFTRLFNNHTEERVKGLTVPTLIVWGDEDKLLSLAGAEIMHKLLPNSQVILMRGIGHMPMIESPKQTAADFLQFQASHQASVKPAS